MYYVSERREVHIKFWWGNQRGTDFMEDLGLNVRMILKWIIKKEFRQGWTRLIWLRMGTNGGLL